MSSSTHILFLCPALAEHTVFVVSVRNGSRRVRSQRESVDWGTMGPALGGAYECYAHISSFHYFKAETLCRSLNSYRNGISKFVDVIRMMENVFNINSKIGVLLTCIGIQTIANYY